MKYTETAKNSKFLFSFMCFDTETFYDFSDVFGESKRNNLH